MCPLRHSNSWGVTFVPEPCAVAPIAFQWKYHENYQTVGHSRVFSDLRGFRTVLWAAKSLQLAARQRRERAVGPRELPFRTYLPPGTEWRQHSCGYQGATAHHDI